MRNQIISIASILLTGLTTTVTTTALLPLPKAVSQTPAYEIIERDEAYRNSVDVPIWAGRSSAIDFSETGETITYVGIADPSRAVYYTDADLESGQARTIFVRAIKPVHFPNLTTTWITNLSVKTKSTDGQIRLYTFNIVPSRSKTISNGVIIAKKNNTAIELTLVIGSNGEIATLSNIEQGLQVAIDRKYTAPDDPIVFKVQEFLALIRNTTTTIPSAASETGVSLTTLITLGQLGQQPIPYTAPSTSPSSSPSTVPTKPNPTFVPSHYYARPIGNSPSVTEASVLKR